jgi:hypothetical protein
VSGTLRQALHILKKDARLLRVEIGLVLVAAAVYAWLYPRSTGEILGLYPAYLVEQGQGPWGHPTWILLALTSVFLIARVVHAEPIPGDRQFWITRPYRWSSLLTAKILFVLLFVNVPILIAQLVVFADSGFALRTNVDGILWSTGLLISVCALPVAALAALTPGTGAFLVTAVLLTGGFYSVQLNLSGPASGGHWIRDTIVGLTLATAASVALVVQYRTRRTGTSARLAAVSCAVALVLAGYLPLPAAMRIQAAVTGSLDASGVGMRADPALRTLSHYEWGENAVVLDVPLVLTGVPDATVLDVHSLDVRFSAGGRDWTPRDVRIEGSGRADLESRIVLWRRDFETARGPSVTMHVSMAATLLGNPDEETLAMEGGRVQVGDGLECYAGPSRPYFVDESRDYRDLYCRAPFGRPRVHLRAVNDGRGNVQVRPTYSPFPSHLNLNQAWEGDAGTFPADTRELRVEIREPVAHFYREFELEIRLEDFVTTGSEDDANVD